MDASGRSRNFRDAPELELEGHVDFADPIERMAIGLRRFTFQTPDDVAGDFAKGLAGDLADSWLALEPAERQLYRRRAFVLLELAERDSSFLEARL